MLEIVFDNKFKKEYKRALKRGHKPEKMETILDILSNEKPIPAKYKDHALTDNKEFKNVRELHIEPDWLLIYRKEKQIQILRCLRTGTHSDLFCLI